MGTTLIEVGVECQKLIKSISHTFKIISLLLFIAAGTASSQNTTCPFQYIYYFGDGIKDFGKSVKIPPFGPFLPAARLPYGTTFPGSPSGRWSDGRIDTNYTAAELGLPNVTPYLSMNPFASYDGVVFAVARSPLLDPVFFFSRGIDIPPNVAPLRLQITWFRKSLTSVCSKPTGCSKRLANSIVLFGGSESNDIGYSLVQGKSIQEVNTYVPYIIQALINAGKELIRMTRLTYISDSPFGCYPYILTALPSADSSAYDDLGCLKSVNDLIMLKNNYLKQAVTNLSREFPDVRIIYSDFYQVAKTVINQTSISGPGGNEALRACCGVGGKYNYNSKRFCRSTGVPVCPNPEKYMFWDGLHFTQEAYRRIVRNLVTPVLPLVNCTTQ